MPSSLLESTKISSLLNGVARQNGLENSFGFQEKIPKNSKFHLDDHFLGCLLSINDKMIKFIL